MGKLHVVFACGGTAGHINPALAVAGTLRQARHDVTISFIGNRKGMEANLTASAGYPFYGIDVAGFKRSFSPRSVGHNLAAVKKLLLSSRRCGALLKTLNPDVVVGTGGYVCGPVLRKAAKMGLKTVVHESNAYPGMTIRMLAPMVDRVLLGMPEAKRYLRCQSEPVTTGNPVRESILFMKRELARSALGLDDRVMILSTGGSQGAKRINDAMAEVIADDCKDGRMIHFHAAGKEGYAPMLAKLRELGVDVNSYPQIHIREYIYNMDETLAAADIVVSRSGAMSLAELQAQGKPSVLVPYPYAAENHQYYNASALRDRGAAVLIEDKDLTGARLSETLHKLESDPADLRRMGEAARAGAVFDANERICACILELCQASK